MTLFFFDIDNGGFLTEDDEGSLLSDRVAASRELISSLVEIAADALRGSTEHSVKGSVRGATGTPFFTAEISLRSSWLPDDTHASQGD